MYIDAYSSILFADNLKLDTEIRTKLVDSFQLGFKAFFKGGRKPIRVNSLQQSIIAKRLKALKFNNEHYANKLAQQLASGGLALVDYVDPNTNQVIKTRVEQITIATSPYIKDTMLDKEWQRGWNKAYLVSQNYNAERNSKNETPN